MNAPIVLYRTPVAIRGEELHPVWWRATMILAQALSVCRKGSRPSSPSTSSSSPTRTCGRYEILRAAAEDEGEEDASG